MRSKNQQCVESWSDLHEDLLQLILIRSDLREHHSVQLVCERWRAAVKQLNKCIYFLLLKCNNCHIHSNVLVSPSDDRLYRLKSPETFNEIQCLGSSHGWFLVIQNTIFLLNPFTGSRINLPPWDSAESIYHFKLSSAPTDPNCIVTMLEESEPSFIFCRIGDDEWTKVEISPEEPPSDILVFRGKFYLLFSQLHATLPTTTTRTKHLREEILMIPFPHESFSGSMSMISYLVESDGNLLLVVKGYRMSSFQYGRTADSFAVFKLDLSTFSWVKMRKIGGQVLFLSHSNKKISLFHRPKEEDDRCLGIISSEA
ncbi:hypothetical protein MRB53_035774 [Persea americana]|uniref:Uncharacterized protein n=1 Tax=Persea americana TaxID=3435 RepID=A0ACC2K5X2_PERAE|nr:hypothetical protein MRB53_035774 [Persea americana]